MNFKFSKLFLFFAILYHADSTSNSTTTLGLNNETLNFNTTLNFNSRQSSHSTESFNSTLNFNSTTGFNSSPFFNSTKLNETLTTPTPTPTYNTSGNIGHLEFCSNVGWQSRCIGEHHLCVDNKCECQPNYNWNQFTQRCEYFICNTSTECQTYDSDRYCQSGECVCNENTIIDTLNGYKCANKTCSSFSDCPNYNCEDGVCECSLGFTMNYESGKCERFNCSTNTECESFDQNMFCDRNGDCVCKDVYNTDFYDGSKCTSIPCYHMSSLCVRQNQVCSGDYCVCGDNYTLSEITGKCELNSCLNSTDCQSRDEHSFCSNGFCQCFSNFKKIYSKSEHKCGRKLCESDSSCPDSNALCVDGQCQCLPNYHLSNISGKCEFYSCANSNECQDYDQNKYCSNGTCQCDNQMFFPDPSNGLKCSEKSCKTKNDCIHNNTVCLDDFCYCDPQNYYYNASTQQCQYYECQSNDDCLNHFDYDFLSDIIRVCHFGQCICPNGSNPDKSNGGKCIAESNTYHKSCNSNNGCHSGEKCVDSLCRCAPNYRFDPQFKECRKFVCNQTSECADYDSARVCNRINGQCVCGNDYVVNERNGDLCTRKSVTFDKPCASQYSCYENGQRCVDGICRCKPNYMWTQDSQQCEYFRCSSGLNYCSDTFDSFRYCDPFSGFCDCLPLYTSNISNGGKCMFNTPVIPTIYPVTPTSNTYDYTYLYVCIPVIFIASIAGGLYRVNRTVRRSNRTKRNDQTHPTQCQPPPPYTERT